METTNQIGVIIGRFQVHELHEGHKQIIENVLSKHKKMIIFLGVNPIGVGTKKNPLDFVSRKLMLEEAFGNRISAILPLKDKKTNEEWSQSVDEKIREVFPMGNAILYGSRDSFIPYYSGKFDTKELEQDVFVSGTEVRKFVSEDIKQSPLFRAGVIYALYNRYPTMYSTIDAAIEMSDGKYLMVKKPYESQYRFCGGFTDITDTNDFHTVRREVAEELGIEVDGFQYITSTRVDDWRYRKEENEKIMTRLFHVKYIHGRVTPMDDISEAKQFELNDLNESNVVPEHLELLEALKSYVKSKTIKS
jgi:bifunctional NMN adenylyltransferase/nudix hydrolase